MRITIDKVRNGYTLTTISEPSSVLTNPRRRRMVFEENNSYHTVDALERLLKYIGELFSEGSSALVSITPRRKE